MPLSKSNKEYILEDLFQESVPSESLFSTTGLITTDLRNRLKPKLVQYILFQKENFRYTQKYCHMLNFLLIFYFPLFNFVYLNIKIKIK